ncbi:1-acyl-sn-glycerol-3-phosphate acyltransferase [Deinococcus knuensis]|uniref:1-acyl-sn-glycerol-3-phosphate acyltransferase n=1 Tax=Deinococcus knuensis TaxID=1837380 RepID=A0ABQ2SG86_9DEIO|nr:1-acyl-sn-glycerol-3-phosphate acyltransferase [Deinococcus knuensis]GGS28103.1 1-acyl-sn-glycerol-3-phosphate acyltransferase [Deinococcus knuensis]
MPGKPRSGQAGGDRHAWATWLLSRSVSRSVRGALGGVWVRGPVPAGGAVLAPNHHSWWDGYVLREAALWAGSGFAVLMGARQLSRFPFLRRVGAVRADEVRAGVRRARVGWLVVFPEGAVQPAGPLRAVQPGAAWIAGAAGVPLVPVALRVVMRGAQAPEAFVRFGWPVTGAALEDALQRELAALDAELLDSDPEAPPAGYLRAVPGRASRSERVDLPSRLLTLITGDR